MPDAPQIVGWREWVALPDLGVPALKAKLDTGARTSALHAEQITPFDRDGAPWVRFVVRPRPKHPETAFTCEAPVVGRRAVRSSNGQTQTRYVIRTSVALGEQTWPIECTLTRRTGMRFPMLLGRTALAGHYAVDPAAGYVTGRAFAAAYRTKRTRS